MLVQANDLFPNLPLVKRILCLYLMISSWSTVAAQTVLSKAFGLNVAPIAFDHIYGYREMSVHNNLNKASQEKSYIPGTRNDLVVQYNLYRVEFTYSRYKGHENNKSPFTEYRYGLGVTLGYNDRISGNNETYNSRDSITVSRSYLIETGLEKYSATFDFIHNSKTKDGARVFIGFRTELGAYSGKSVAQHTSTNIAKAGQFISFTYDRDQPLEMKPSMLASLQGMLGLDLNFYNELSLRAEIHWGVGRLHYFGGTGYNNLLFSLNLGLRNAW